MDMITLGLLWYLIFLFSTTLHEAAHAWAGMKMGDLTAYYGGQVSLNPAPHIRRERVGMVIVPILSFIMYNGAFMIGWASAPYNPHWANRYPKRAAWMSLAGPASNLLLVLTAGVLIRIGLFTHVLAAPNQIHFGKLAEFVIAHPNASPLAGAIAVALSILFSLNLLLCCFNLIPLPPMDGSGVITLFMRHETALRFRNFMANPGMALFGFIIAIHLFWDIFRPICRFALNTLYFGVSRYG